MKIETMLPYRVLDNVIFFSLLYKHLFAFLSRNVINFPYFYVQENHNIVCACYSLMRDLKLSAKVSKFFGLVSHFQLIGRCMPLILPRLQIRGEGYPLMMGNQDIKKLFFELLLILDVGDNPVQFFSFGLEY